MLEIFVLQYYSKSHGDITINLMVIMKCGNICITVNPIEVIRIYISISKYISKAREIRHFNHLSL